MPGMWTLGLNNTLGCGFTVGVSALHAGAGVLWDAWTGAMGLEAVWGSKWVRGCAGAGVFCGGKEWRVWDNSVI